MRRICDSDASNDMGEPTTVIPGRCKASDLRCAIAHRESRDSGFDASHRPGMTERGFARRNDLHTVVTGLDPVIHLPRRNFLRRLMDARIKSGHDGCVLWREAK